MHDWKLTLRGAGVDMSESAIQTAQQLMHEALGSSLPIFFHVSDMLSFLKQTFAKYDVVLGAFSLHHLTSEDKVEVMVNSYHYADWLPSKTQKLVLESDLTRYWQVQSRICKNRNAADYPDDA